VAKPFSDLPACQVRRRGSGQAGPQGCNKGLDVPDGPCRAAAIVLPVVEQGIPGDARRCRRGLFPCRRQRGGGFDPRFDKTARLAQFEDVIAFLQRRQDVKRQLPLFLWRHCQFVAATSKQASDSGDEGLGVATREGARDSSLEVGDVLLQGVEIFVIHTLAPPLQIGVQTDQPERLDAGHQLRRDLGDGLVARVNGLAQEAVDAVRSSRRDAETFSGFGELPVDLQCKESCFADRSSIVATE